MALATVGEVYGRTLWTGAWYLQYFTKIFPNVDLRLRTCVVALQKKWQEWPPMRNPYKVLSYFWAQQHNSQLRDSPLFPKNLFLDRRMKLVNFIPYLDVLTVLAAC